MEKNIQCLYLNKEDLQNVVNNIEDVSSEEVEENMKECFYSVISKKKYNINNFNEFIENESVFNNEIIEKIKQLEEGNNFLIVYEENIIMIKIYVLSLQNELFEKFKTGIVKNSLTKPKEIKINKEENKEETNLLKLYYQLKQYNENLEMIKYEEKIRKIIDETGINPTDYANESEFMEEVLKYINEKIVLDIKEKIKQLKNEIDNLLEKREFEKIPELTNKIKNLESIKAEYNV